MRKKLFSISVRNYTNYYAKVIVSDNPLDYNDFDKTNSLLKKTKQNISKLLNITNWFYCNNYIDFKPMKFDLVSIQDRGLIYSEDLNKKLITVPFKKVYINVWLYDNFSSFQVKINQQVELNSNLNIIRTY